jgi:hypothetical protein
MAFSSSTTHSSGRKRAVREVEAVEENDNEESCEESENDEDGEEESEDEDDLVSGTSDSHSVRSETTSRSATPTAGATSKTGRTRKRRRRGLLGSANAAKKKANTCSISSGPKPARLNYKFMGNWKEDHGQVGV